VIACILVPWAPRSCTAAHDQLAGPRTEPVEHRTRLTPCAPTGPAQPLRNTTPNMFQVQPQQNAARAPLGTNRLQNGKLGETAPAAHACRYVTDDHV
jgi:hypothetical protein